MAIDTSIYSQLLRPPKSVAEYDAEAMQAQQNRLAMQINQSKLAEQQAGVARTNKLATILGGFAPGMAAADQGDTLTRAGFIDEGRKVIESGAKVNKDQRESEKAQREAEKFQFEQARDQIAFVNQIVSSAKDQASYTQGRQAMAARGMDVSAIPEQFDPAYVAAAGQQSLTELQRIDDVWKAKKYDLEERQFGEQVRSNKAQDADRDASRAQSERASLRSDARAREQGVAARSTVVQTDAGPLMVNTRTGESQPVTGADGKPVGARLKDVPAVVRRTITENDAALRKVDEALREVDSYPEALGVKNYLGDTVRQRSDPKGIKARALVADIGSLKIHDRSGAAVTASETPRLKPFIPAATDDPNTVKEKLGLFRKEYEAIQTDLRETYSRDQGYRAPTEKTGGGATRVSNASDYAKLPSGAEYIDPQGNTRRKP